MEQTDVDTVTDGIVIDIWNILAQYVYAYKEIDRDAG